MIKILIVSLLSTALAIPMQSAANTCRNGICENPTPSFPSDSSAQFTNPDPSVVRILVKNTRSQSYGTGTWIQYAQNQKFILTCAHLFEAEENPQQVLVFFPNSSTRLAKLHAIDRTWDLALLNSEEQANTDTPSSTFPAGIPIAENFPNAGDSLLFAGYGNDGRYRVVNGKLYGYCRIGRGKTSETLVVSGQARSGDSGGPILNRQGKLVGVLWGTDSRTVCGTYQGRIRKFVQNARPIQKRVQETTQTEPSTEVTQSSTSTAPRIFRNPKTPQSGNISGENSAEILKSLRELRELRQGKTVCQRLLPWYLRWIPNFSTVAILVIVSLLIYFRFFKKHRSTNHENTRQNS